TFARYLRCGITSVVDVGGPYWNFEVRELARQSDMAPTVAVAGPLISTVQRDALMTDDPPIIKVTSAREALRLVRKQAEHEPDLIKIWYIAGRPDSDVPTAEKTYPIIEATIRESHKLGLRVAVHATGLETARLAVNAGADVLVHSVTDKEVDDEFLQLLKDNNVIYIPTVVVWEGYGEVYSQQVNLLPVEYELGNPYIAGTLFDLRHLPEADIPERVRTRIAEAEPVMPREIALKNLKRVQEAGVLVAAGTDAGNIGTLHGPSIFRELELMAQAGLSPMEILTDATLNGARVMGRENELGTIEAGKLADLVILNADPMLDILNTSDIQGVVKHGRYYPADEIIKPSPTDIVQRQDNAYNAHDIEAFLAT
ncbi:MAG: amidohydrolase family protein, partial [Fidelibacterota bacterium]